MKKLLPLLFLLLLSSKSYAFDVNINLRTNWVPSTEFEYIMVELIHINKKRPSLSVKDIVTAASRDYAGAVTVSRFTKVRRGKYKFIVTLMDSQMSPIDGNVQSVDIDRNTDLTSVINKLVP